LTIRNFKNKIRQICQLKPNKMKYTIFYRDHLGRKNQTQSSGEDSIEAEQKFKVLYPDCVVVEVVNN